MDVFVPSVTETVKKRFADARGATGRFETLLTISGFPSLFTITPTIQFFVHLLFQYQSVQDYIIFSHIALDFHSLKKNFMNINVVLEKKRIAIFIFFSPIS